MRTWTTCTDGKRNSYLRFFGTPSLDTPVWAWCDCPYFKFYCEVVLSRYNCSTIRNSNGMLPVVRNKRMIPHLCKHLLIAAKYAVQEKRDLVQEELDKQTAEQEALAGKKAAGFGLRAGRGQMIPKGRFTRPSGKETGLVDL
jgi:hypothetical protein